MGIWQLGNHYLQHVGIQCQTRALLFLGTGLLHFPHHAIGSGLRVDICWESCDPPGRYPPTAGTRESRGTQLEQSFGASE